MVLSVRDEVTVDCVVKRGGAKVVVSVTGAISADCDVLSHEDAPVFGNEWDRKSKLRINTTDWAMTIVSLGLWDVIFGEGYNHQPFQYKGSKVWPLIGGSSGPTMTLIRPEHLEIIVEKLNERHLRQVSSCLLVVGDDCSLRADWLRFWVDYALRNFDFPVFFSCC